MKKSFVLLSALVVTTTFIVNCQKAPDKRRVRPTAGGSGTQTDVIEKAKLPTKVCSAELLNNYRSFHKSQDLLRKTVITAASTEAEKESQKKLGVETLAKCDDLITQLKTEGNQGCYLDNGVKDVSNALMASSMQNLCNSLGQKLKTEVELDSSYADAAKENEKAKEDAKKVESDLIGKSLSMSKEARSLVLQNNTDGGKFLADGEIRSSTSSLETALAASQTVCTFLGDGIAIKEDVEATLTIVSTSAAEKIDLAALKADFEGKATLLSTEIAQEETQETIGLLCLNLDATKLSVEKIKKALGTGITSAAVQVATEVTDGASEAAKPAAVSATAFTANDLAAAQPAGSPQAQNLASGTAQMIADANVITAQKAASQTAVVTAKPAAVASTPVVAAAQEEEKEEQEEAAKEEPAKVTVVTTPVASASASATVATKEQAEDAAGQLAMLKEKAERLEAEAVAAEADVKKLEEAKAKAEDIDQAKAKARITRESANSAKAEYAEAQKATPAVAAN